MMSLKLKALGLGLLAALAVSAVAVVNAGATQSGHFESDSPSSKTTIVGEESPGDDFSHKIEFGAAGLPSKPIGCTNASFHGLATAKTVTEIAIVPTYSSCRTTNGDGTSLSGSVVDVRFNGCNYVFRSRSEPGDATAGLACPAGKKVELEDTGFGGCTLSFGPQTIANAVTYDTDTKSAGGHTKHAITLTATGAGISFTAHKGACVFIGTTQTNGTLNGSATVWGTDPDNNQTLVNLTAT